MSVITIGSALATLTELLNAASVVSALIKKSQESGQPIPAEELHAASGRAQSAIDRLEAQLKAEE